MNCKTRGEKIDEFIANAKRVAITGLLILWGIITMATGVALGMEKHKTAMLEKEITKLESMTGYKVKDLMDAEVIYIRR